jgi:hypothetical protein
MKTQAITISPPNFQVAEFRIRGTAPFVQHKFSQKARRLIRQTQEAGQTAKKGKAKEPKDFAAECEACKHISTDGWCGIPAPAFRNAMISACRMAGYQMTRAKLAVFVVADGFDADDMTPLVKITKGEPQYSELMARVAMGKTDIRPRPMWAPGWEAVLKVRFDADQFTLSDVANLLMRAGMQVGVGEGRPDSPSSCGMGWGTFEIAEQEA